MTVCGVQRYWGGLRWSDAQPLDFCCVRRMRGLAQIVLAYQDAGVWYAGRRLMPWCYREDAKPVQEPKREFLVGQPMGYP